MSLEKSIDYYEKNRAKFVKEHHHEFIVIFGENVEGFYPDVQTAFLEAKKKYPDGGFLLRECITLEEEPEIVFHSRVG